MEILNTLSFSKGLVALAPPLFWETPLAHMSSFRVLGTTEG